MITTFLTGGLGNQMFQYAAARALSEELHVGLRLDLSLLKAHGKNTTPRQYELEKFTLNTESIKATSSFCKGLFFQKIYSQVKVKCIGKLAAKQLALFTDKETYNFDQRFLALQDEATLLGYFQSEKYFKSHETIIRAELKFKNPLLGQNLEAATLIQSSESVAIHIRRGDYMSNAQAASNYATCSTDYYLRAIDYICSKVGNPRFFIFSDEPEVAKQELNLANATYIDWNMGNDSHNDMHLMSLCQHNIIANSSFSWWGAWLNANHEKIVVAPRQWFRNVKKNSNVKDLIPETWMRC